MIDVFYEAHLTVCHAVKVRGEFMRKYARAVLWAMLIWQGDTYANSKFDHTQISLFKLSIHPEKYERQKLIVSGFLVMEEKETPKLYFSRDSFSSNSPDYLVLNDFPEQSLGEAFHNCSKGCFASVIGTFEYSKYNSPYDLIGFVEKTQKVVFWKD